MLSFLMECGDDRRQPLLNQSISSVVDGGEGWVSSMSIIYICLSCASSNWKKKGVAFAGIQCSCGWVRGDERSPQFRVLDWIRLDLLLTIS